ncbi:helix-turn-helix domain-containing protein [Streptomyces albidoflavus]
MGADVVRKEIDKCDLKKHESVRLAKIMNRALTDELLPRCRITQKQVARAMETSQSAVSDFERLGGDPRLSTIMRYARAVGMAVAMKAHVVDEPGLSERWEPLAHSAEVVPVARGQRGAA